MAVRALALVLVSLCAVQAEAQQAPPPAVRYDQHVSAGGLPPAADSLRNPVAGDSAAVVDGAKLFDGFNCGGCHPGAGPALTDGRWKYGGSDAALFATIYYGRARGMPAYGGAVPTESIWRIVTWLRAVNEGADTVATRRW
jgi:cytochrome c oxidase cbb3-type subunit 3